MEIICILHIILGSGWKVLRPFYVDAEVVEFKPLNGSAGDLHVACYARQRGIKPDEKSTLLKDNGYCFYAAVAAAMIGTGANAEELDNWYSDAAAKFGPNVDIKTVPKVEKFWREEKGLSHISINVVYCDENQRIMPVLAGANPLGPKQIVLIISHTAGETAKRDMEGNADMQEDNDELLTVQTTELMEEDMSKHFSLVVNPDKLFGRRLRSQISDKVTNKGKFICWNCINSYGDGETLENHLAYCRENKCQQVIMPKAGETMKFKSKVRNEHGLPDGVDDDVLSSWRTRSFRSAYVLYFDFEALHVVPEKVCSCPKEMVERREEYEERQWKVSKYSEEQLAEWAADEQMLDGVDTRDLEARKFDAAGTRKRCFNFPPRPRPKKMCQHKTKIKAEQHAFAYSYYLVNRDGDVLENKAVHSLDAAESFVQDVMNIADNYLPNLSPGVTMRQMTDYEKSIALGATQCYLCQEDFDEAEPNFSRVLDHDHLNGEFLGVAHNICNLHRREDFTLTCFSHNFSGYDSHFIVKVLGRMTDKEGIRAIPLNTQKFKCLTVNNRIQFVDSAAFLNAPLAECASTLVKSEHDFPMLDELCDDDYQKQLLLRKGVYPYTFATSIEKLMETKQLPPRSAFYNELSDQDISDEDYIHAERVWEAFDIKNMLEYTTLYLRTDTVLLAECMTNLRDNMWDDFKLDITKYLSLPMLAKDIMLKTTEVEMELIADQEMSDLVQKNLRGGLSFINKRKAVKVDEEEALWEDDTRSLLYTDCTNLYGKAMCMPLPLSDFEWMSQDEIDNFDPLKDITDKTGTGYFLEVDLEYPSHLHEKHNSYPLAAESLEITDQDLSPYAFSCLAEISGGKKKKHKTKKLTSTFYPRTKYLCHGLNLQLYLKHGLKLVRIHRGIKFQQVDFIRPYIEMCSDRRRTAKSEALRNMYKLLCNSLYGKLIEGFEKRMNCLFNKDRATALKNSSNPLFKASVICDEDLSISFMKRPMVYMNQCWAVGFAVLELSKYWMQKVYYEDIQPAFQKRGGCSVLMSDTDSFLLETACKSADEAVELILPLMDTSNYDPAHRLYSDHLAKVPGYMKNEVPKDEINLFVGLKSKTYAIQTKSNAIQMKAKGIPERHKHKIPINEMLNCLTRMKTYSVDYHALRSVDHLNQLVKSSRVAFSSFDDKRYLLCPVHSVPYGSSLIEKSKELKGCYFCYHKDILV